MAANTTLLTTMNSVIAAGPTAPTTANSNAPAGPITDYPGMLQSTLVTMEETKLKLQNLVALTDASDPNLTNLQNMVLTFS